MLFFRSFAGHLLVHIRAHHDFWSKILLCLGKDQNQGMASSAFSLRSKVYGLTLSMAGDFLQVWRGMLACLRGNFELFFDLITTGDLRGWRWGRGKEKRLWGGGGELYHFEHTQVLIEFCTCITANACVSKGYTLQEEAKLDYCKNAQVWHPWSWHMVFRHTNRIFEDLFILSVLACVTRTTPWGRSQELKHIEYTDERPCSFQLLFFCPSVLCWLFILSSSSDSSCL